MLVLHTLVFRRESCSAHMFAADLTLLLECEERIRRNLGITTMSDNFCCVQHFLSVRALMLKRLDGTKVLHELLLFGKLIISLFKFVDGRVLR